MTRGVRNDGPSWDVTRQRTISRGSRNEQHFEVIFSYRGGAYIDVRFAGSPHAHDVINVWDYENDASIVTERVQFITEVNNYMDAQTAHDLRAAWENRPR
jgi:hypothetical protein